MKQFVLCLMVMALTFGALSASAQTEKNDWLVGGNFNLNTVENNTGLEFRPSAGFFILKNLALGGNFTIAYSKTGPTKTTQFGVGPYARFYFTDNIFRPFLYGDISFISNKTQNIEGKTTVKGTNFLLGVGGAYFINDNVAIEGITGYSHAKLKNLDGSGGFALRLGFQVYLNSHQVASLRQ